MDGSHYKQGAMPPAYDEVPMAAPHDTNIQNRSRPVQTSKPWWNPRYWRKRVWIAIAVILLIIIVIAVAVGVTQSKSNKYPDYSALSYALSETYGGESFFDNFDYFTGYDPTAGFVHYVPRAQAEQLNLTYASSETAVLRVDTSVGPNDEPNASTGRFSVRVTSRKTYDDGLFIFDIKHSPFGCGTWPALWLTNPYNWPDDGEIDVMEAVNQADDGNQMTLHTTSGCKMNVKRKQTGKAEKTNCDHDANDNAGCGVADDKDSYGESFNENEGGVMAVEWRDAGIRIWQWARSAIPSDIASKKPNPSTWGTANADFPGTDCNIGNHFRNQSIVANINLCGQLTEASYSSSNCPSNCTDYVANNPDAFKNAFWEFGSFEVYQAS
ncbi:concanavalin A-like lectin/glucanase domain-containing protein [Emericellopsis atlantica]|uniref:endo-1,3(4)-beta-glucanase n=1 Tax=Emericellopsis atlantica TaxID=2614577 RepID=A0A9P7ZF00_9HYPO|nr:concanavalin A-like lectin/glucanase domain-containing protein [Emericellopsis atlantica]KAG9250924.1 concanavalin A-like lectin/glucanase domain-containing protein [Emericellopsis atlantica]